MPNRFMNFYLKTFMLCAAHTAFTVTITPRPVYIGVVPTSFENVLMEKFRPTFQDFLSATMSENVVVVSLSRTEAFEALQNKTIEFIFADQSVFACLESEFSGQHVYACCFNVSFCI
jgi:hypothetical protein